MFNRNSLTAAILLTISSGAIGAVPNEPNDTRMIEEVAVVGIRGSLQAASDMKRDSAVIQDSIVVEDIGKFPDQNVAESLQRISGVSIDRDRGEGSKITVRGFGPAFNVVKLNDRTLATTSRGRDFDFQILASELISGADVVKTPMGKTPAGSIGAYVNVKTARPLDNPGLKIAGSINSKHNALSGDNSPQYSGIFSNTFANDTLGVLVGFSKQESSNRVDSTSTSHWSVLPATAVTGDIVNTEGEVVTPDQLRFAGRHQFGIAQEERERTAANATFQWAPSEVFTHTLDVLYSDFGNVALGQGLQIPLQRNGWRNVVVSDDNTILAAEKFQGEDDMRGHPLDGFFSVSGTESETKAIGFNTKAEFGRLALNFDASISEADATVASHAMVPNYINGDDGLNEFTYSTLNSDVVDFTTTVDYADPANARAHYNEVIDSVLKDEITDLKLDASYYDINMGALVSIDAGIAYGDRTKSKDIFAAPDGCKHKDIPWSDPNLAQYNTCGTYRDMPDSVFSVSSVSDFLSEESGNFPRDFILVSDIDAYHVAIQELRGDTWPQKELIENASVETTEKTTSLYTQFNFESQLGAYDWRGNLGLRYLGTDTSSTGHRRDRVSMVAGVNSSGEPLIDTTFTEDRAVSIDNSYSGFLPSANFSIDFANGFLARAAASKVMSRPKIEDIGVDRSYNNNHAGTFSSGGGNPYLEPYEAKQFDLSLEYYHDNGDAYAVNLFHKDLSSFISTIVTQDSSPDIFVDGAYVDSTVEVPGFGNLVETITQKENRPGGSISGIEIAALHHFDYLPGIFSGLGIQANYTHLTSKDDSTEALELEGVREPGSGLEGFAEDSYNIIGFYDKDGIQLRAAYNWRGDYLSHREDGGLPRHVDAYGQLDLRASYDLTENITVSASAVNVTDERVFHYADSEERMRLIQYAGPRYLVGVSVRF